MTKEKYIEQYKKNGITMEMYYHFYCEILNEIIPYERFRKNMNLFYSQIDEINSEEQSLIIKNTHKEKVRKYFNNKFKLDLK